MAKERSPEEKKELILQAARKVLVEKGYTATTISLVAKEAGVSRGLLHYYFKNKEEMLAIVIQNEIDNVIMLGEAFFSDCNSIDDVAKKTGVHLRNILENDPYFYPIFFEGWSVAHQSNIVKTKIEAYYHKLRLVSQSSLQDAVDRGIISPSIPLFALASVLIALMDGIGLQMVTAPELINNEDVWEAARKAYLSLLKGKD